MNVQVIGSGSWGLALACVLEGNGNNVRLWCRPEDDPDTLRRTRQNKTYLPGVLLPDSIDVVTEVADDSDIDVFAVPSHAMRPVAAALPLSESAVRVTVAKGIENDTLLRMSQVIEMVAPGGPVVALSGPSHAEEVGRGLPASLVAAGSDIAACEAVQQAFFTDNFRVYTSPDIVGVELGGSLKNVIAIAAGACDGFGLGDNAKAALVTRGLAEISRLGVVCGADPLTFAGLSGMGDLITTCMSGHSRNRRVGERIAKGETLQAILDSSPMVAEGVRTTRSAVALAKEKNVELPIAETVHGVLFDGVPPGEAIQGLLQREAKPERG